MSDSSGGGGVFNFDLGNLFAGLGAEQMGTAECGSRPSCFTEGKTCKSKRESYDACVMANIEGINQARLRDAQNKGTNNKNITYAIIGIGLLIVISRFFK